MECGSRIVDGKLWPSLYCLCYVQLLYGTRKWRVRHACEMCCLSSSLFGLPTSKAILLLSSVMCILSLQQHNTTQTHGMINDSYNINQTTTTTFLFFLLQQYSTIYVLWDPPPPPCWVKKLKVILLFTSLLIPFLSLPSLPFLFIYYILIWLVINSSTAWICFNYVPILSFFGNLFN